MKAQSPWHAALWLMLAVGQSACHDPDAYTLSPTRLDEILSISTSAQTVPADGVSQITITVRLDPRTDADKRLVTITTTGGSFVRGNQVEGLAVVVPVDDIGRAVIELRSSYVAGPVQLDVKVGTVSRSVTLQFSEARREDLFSIDLTRTTLPADGFSTARITVTLRRPGTVQQRVVTFETSGGTLLATGIASARQATVTADTNGVAVVDLQSDKTVGPVRLSIKAVERTEIVELSFIPADPTQVITLSADRSSAPADGVTTIALVARVAANLPAGRRSVTFRTTVGHFLPGRSGEFTIEADGSNMARATLASSTVGGARLTATVDGTTAETSAEFSTALPDSVFVSAAAAALRSGESTLVTVTLLRQVGEVSPRLSVTYSAATSGGAPIGAFSGVTLSNQGVSSATFNVGTSAYVGPVTITAAAGTAAGVATVQIVP
jgi:hypothetical protein